MKESKEQLERGGERKDKKLLLFGGQKGLRGEGRRGWALGVQKESRACGPAGKRGGLQGGKGALALNEG